MLVAKVSSNQSFDIKLTPNKKIINEVPKRFQSLLRVGFKAEYAVSDDKLLIKAYDRLQSSNMDLIIANDVGKRDERI